MTGFGDNNIYFVDFGIKTARDGSYVFDQTSFDRTYTNSPEKFDALTEDKAYASDPDVFVYATAGSAVPAGKHTFTDSDDKLDSWNYLAKDLTFLVLVLVNLTLLHQIIQDFCFKPQVRPLAT